MIVSGFTDYALSGGPGVISDTVPTKIDVINVNNGGAPFTQLVGQDPTLAVDADGINTGTRTSCKPPRRTQWPPCGGCVQQTPPCDAGHFCSSEWGTGIDNPMQPEALTDVQKSRTVSFFFQDFTQFEVSVTLAARSSARRVGRA